MCESENRLPTRKNLNKLYDYATYLWKLNLGTISKDLLSGARLTFTFFASFYNFEFLLDCPFKLQ